jgi:hypothetical protein
MLLWLVLSLACPAPGNTAAAPRRAPDAEDQDGDGFSAEAGDCDDEAPEVHPGAAERCGSGRDEDCDGRPGDCSLSGDRSLSEVTGRVLGSAVAETGRALSGAGDLNRDGLSDLLVASRKAGGGAVSVFLGPLDGEVLPEDADATLSSPRPGEDLGRSVAGLGDVDGDGYDDLLVGALSGPGLPAAAGVAWLVGGPLIGAFPVDEIADVRIFGVEVEGGLGLTVAGPGDTNGDGRADLLLGLPRGDGGAHAGLVALLLGPVPLDRPLSSAEALFEGEAGGDFAGTALSSAGDVDGDGLDDTLVGAWGSRGFTGRAYLLLGPQRGTVTLADADRTWSGEATWDALGWSVASAGDTDGDGRDDVLLGAYGRDTPDFSAGAAYLQQDPLQRHTLAEATATFTGGQPNDRLGWAVAGAGDTDGDGFDDIMLGAPGSDRGVAEGGDVALFLCPVGGTLSVRVADARFSGDLVGGAAGSALAGLGDTNGDRTSDLLIGGPGAGIAWIVPGLGW